MVYGIGSVIIIHTIRRCLLCCFRGSEVIGRVINGDIVGTWCGEVFSSCGPSARLGSRSAGIAYELLGSLDVCSTWQARQYNYYGEPPI